MFWYNSLFSIYLTGNGFGRKTIKKLNKMQDDLVYTNNYVRLVEDALLRYKFENLPDTVSERVLLQSLLWYGSVVFFEKGGGVLALPGCPSEDGFSIYGEPGSAYVFSRNGQLNENIKLFIPGSDLDSYLKLLTTGVQTGIKKGVMVYENRTRYPFILVVEYFSRCIADTFRTIDVARTNIKSPYIITAEESIVPTVKKYFETRNDNNEYVISSGVFPSDRVSLLPINTSVDSLKAATELCDWYENKFRELCGLQSNTQIDKKGENLITDEVHINDEYEDFSVDKILTNMQYYLDVVNSVFGLNIKVKKYEVENKGENNEKNMEEEYNNV